MVTSWCGVPEWSGVFLCGCIVLRWRCVFLFSSCSALGRRLFLAGVFFCASSCGACGFPRCALPQVTLRGLHILCGSICLSCSCGGAVSVVSLVQRMFSVFSLALPTVPAVLRSSPYHKLSFGVSASSLLLPARLLLWWRRLGSHLFPCVLSASPAPAGLPMFGVLHPV